ncbi:10241_t:CDS:2 [Diversispora eburnea]|uniref:10241_t:CDS:1 n=1 Tax=Diversispora eburnea TaxID=1213867 RepID=A0A9N8YQS9_9GLOM|nr:10241_t:CDS:2 [Diversispora eburnea]
MATFVRFANAGYFLVQKRQKAKDYQLWDTSSWLLANGHENVMRTSDTIDTI